MSQTSLADLLSLATPPVAITFLDTAPAGVAGAGPAMGRPTCAVVPEAIKAARTAASFGCVGNRTRAGDDEGYFAIPGAQLHAVEEKLAVVVRANAELEKFHRTRAAAASQG